MPYFHHDVVLAETKIKEHLPNAFIQRSDKGFGLSIYTPTMGFTVVFQRAVNGAEEVQANLDELITKYRPVPPEVA